MMQKWTIPAESSVSICFLLFDRFSNICLANCLEPLRAANTLAGRQVYNWQFLTPDGLSAASSSRLQILPDAALKDMAQCDYLCVVASYDYLKHDTATLRQALRQAAQKCKTLVGLDSGPWLMASAGLLDGKRATVHWEMLDLFSERFLTTDTTRQRVVYDGNRVTCAGAMAAFDLTRQMIQSHLGNAIALDVDAMLMHDEGLGMKDARRPNSGHNPVQRAIAEMHKNIERPLPLSDIARLAACPLKTLSRRFQASLGTSPGQVYRHIRLSEARQLIESTSLSISEIALRCGYESPAALSRAFRLRFGVAPTALGLPQGAPR